MTHAIAVVLAADRFSSPHVRPRTVISYDEIVADVPGLVAYWKFQGGGPTIFNSIGINHATVTGSPETGVPTIVRNDTVAEGAISNGLAIAWPGTTGDFAQVARWAEVTTLNATIGLTFQCDSLNETSTLIASNATSGQVGEFVMQINTNGSPQINLRNSAGTPVTLTGVAGDVQLNQAYTIFFRHGTAGMMMDLYNSSGALVRHLQNTTMTTGQVGALSAIRFGAWHTDISHHDGPYARVFWYNRALTTAQIQSLALAKTINRNPVGTGTEFFIATTGSDSNAGSASAPWRTFAHADSVINPGTTVTVMPGVYIENTIILQTSGTVGNPIVWRSQTRHAAIIRPVNGQSGLEVVLIDANYVHFDGFECDGTPYPQLLGGVTTQLSHTEIRNCWIHNIRALGSTDGASGILTGDGPTSDYSNVDSKIYNNKVNDIGDLNNPSALVHGIYLAHVDNRCFNNIVYRVEGGGIHCWHAASDIHIHHNTIFDCGDSGMILGHDTFETGNFSNAKVSNNIVIDCPNGIRTSGVQGTGNEARNNTCYNCPDPFDIVGSWTQSGGLTTNPVLINYQISGTGDYRPVSVGSPSSPSVNSGVATWVPSIVSIDYDNNPRPLGAAPDRGAYEVI